MPRLILALAAALSLSAPVAAQSLSTLLPLISFPDTVVDPSTKGCAVETDKVCQLQE
ncbi:hypothetical protein [Tabrizicola aquatica]|uniref:hypothetical protein n=1 Tax=Tabrizicola aquatica TaxID=909926 RepID=UPI0015E17EE5|nr:hypothetical protein [Tabrizicola aquatica]